MRWTAARSTASSAAAAERRRARARASSECSSGWFLGREPADHTPRRGGRGVTSRRPSPPARMSPLAEAEAVRRLHAQYETARALAESASLAEAAPRILKAICETLGLEHGAVWTSTRRDTSLRCVDTWHAPSVAFAEFEAVSAPSTFERAASGCPGRVWRSGEPAWIPDVTRDTNFPRADGRRAREGLHGAFGFPILLGGDRARRARVLQPRDPRSPTTCCSRCWPPIGSQIGQFSRAQARRGRARRPSSGCPATCCASPASTATSGGSTRPGRSTLGFTTEELMAARTSSSCTPTTAGASSRRGAQGRGRRATAPCCSRTATGCKDGAYRWLSWNADADLEQGLIYCAARDVTEQKRAAARARSGARGRRGGEPREERLPGQHEPRDPHADERGDRHEPSCCSTPPLSARCSAST